MVCVHRKGVPGMVYPLCQYTLEVHEITLSPNQYIGYNLLSKELQGMGK